MRTFNILTLLMMIQREKEPTDYCVCECENLDYEKCNNCTRGDENAEYSDN